MILTTSNGLAQEYYTLPEIREQASEGWHKTYTDKYSRESTVDIDVQVFGEQTAPILKMGFPNYKEYLYRQNTPYNTVSDIKSGKSATHIVYTYGEKVDLDKAYGTNYGNDLTLREAYDFLIPLLEQQGMSKEDVLLNPPAEFDVPCCLNQKTGELVASAFYLVRLWPKMYELPILNHAASGFRKQGWPICRPRVMFQMRNQEEYFLYITTLIEQEKLAEDIPLCSLEQVIQNVETYIETGYVQKVLSLRFGYALYNDPTIVSSKPVSSFDAECYYAVPSWVLECIFSENPKENAVERIRQKILNDPEFLDEHGGKVTMIINAQTGKMLDPFDRSKNGYGDADYKGFISWNDVK